ncbi:glycosyltransferase family 1 protein [Paenibacillus sp. FSL H8-0034]|uniref:glycosyltransferase family 1 protein n=1 Tax=Paenibacillus sp. FSL H8-0034 TaxID=2954671 RepID=UPI0030FC9392
MGYPIRVLHVVVNMNRGGAETLIMNLYRNMDRSKFQFDFLTCKEGVFDAEIVEMGGVIHRIPYVNEVGHFGYIKALKQFFATHQEYTIVHSHMDKMTGFVLRVAKEGNVPTRIAHSHNTSSEGNAAVKAYKWYAGRYIGHSATHRVACSKKAARWLFADQEEKTMIVMNGIESEQFAFSLETREQVRQELSLTEDHFVVGHVGRFAHQKNHSFLIDIFAQLNKERPESVLVLAGDGPLRFEIEKKIRDLNLRNSVLFLGIRGDINRLLQAFDVFVFPSWHEGLPVTLIEAQAAGLPCFISESITPEVDTGIELVDYLPLSDKMAWVSKIKSLITQSSQAPRNLSAYFLSSKGYDIKNTAQWAENFYSTVSR